MRHWHNTDVQRFIRHNRGFDKHGIFLLDRTHLVVPENANYKDAVRIAEAFGYKWTKYDEYSKYGVKYLEEVTVVGEVKIWKGCEVALYIGI